ncbi:MAG: tetratricopeptide repeat protein, partial [Chitinophagaceae bacterium]|nr:tetratricopeptide repeat protein [Chitinophagaceae bacterium]
MKNTLLVLAAALSVTAGYAQKKNIQSASNSLKYKEYKEAMEYIEEAVKDPSTKDDPKAWLVRGSIYLSMDQDPGYTDKGYYKEAITSYKKVVELKPNYETDAVNNGLMYGAYKCYNTAVMSYNAKKWDDAYNDAKQTVEIHDMDGGKRFSNKGFDTVASGALVIQAYSAFYSGQVDKALPVLEALKSNPIEGNNANTYLIIADAYKKKGDQAKELATLEEAKAKFPNNTNIRNEELNYYIRTNQQDKLIAKLQEAVTSEPENAVYQYNLANAYTNMAFPKKSDGSSDTQPGDYKDLVMKAEKGFEKAISLDPDNVGYHYDMGVLFFNQASQVTEQMNLITGTTPEDDKKYNDLKAIRDGLFEKAFPHL